MGKKKKKEIAQRERDIYKLVALRLLENDEYIQDLNKLKKSGEYVNYYAKLYDTKHTIENEIRKKYNIGAVYDIDHLKEVKAGRRGLVAEMSRIVSVVLDRNEILNEEEGYICLKIKYDAPKELIKYMVDVCLDAYRETAKKYSPQKKKRFRKEQIAAMVVWDKRKLRIPFPKIAKELSIMEATTKKRYYKAYELIYNRKFNPAKYEKPEIKKEYLKRVCGTCQERAVCKDLCPDVFSYINQDQTSQREVTVGVADKLSKDGRKKTNIDYDDI